MSVDKQQQGKEQGEAAVAAANLATGVREASLSVAGLEGVVGRVRAAMEAADRQEPDR